MSPELKTKWVAALRSGTYPQTRLSLHDGRGYCCLGVLYDVDCGPTPMNGTPEHADAYRHIGSLLGPNVRQSPFWGLNDNEGKSFNEIADYIEANV